ncbi:early nodulin-like protein 1 [Medicago truncatula]|nr:early nodulin-like protein 1 [Medicago truncatula]
MRCGFLLFVSTLILSSSLSYAYTYNVGAKDGWTVKPSQDYNYNFWASNIRFQINDTLFFKYQKGSDSVLVVNKQDYDSCNINNPIHNMDNGDSSFLLDKSDHYYFISGKDLNCVNGEKFNLVVLSPHHHHYHEHHGPSLSPAVAPVHPPTSPSPWNAPTPDAHGTAVPTPSARDMTTLTSSGVHNGNAPAIAPASNDHGHNSPAPSPARSDSTRLTGSVGVIVMVVLVLGSFTFFHG